MATSARHLMDRQLTARSLERSQWYSDLVSALGEAEKLLELMEADGSFAEGMGPLRQRIQILRSELSLLNRYTLGEERILPGHWPEAAAPFRSNR